MRELTFFNPTRIEPGKGKESNIGQYVKEFGVGSAPALYGSDRIKRDGLLERVTASLKYGCAVLARILTRCGCRSASLSI